MVYLIYNLHGLLLCYSLYTWYILLMVYVKKGTGGNKSKSSQIQTQSKVANSLH